MKRKAPDSYSGGGPPPGPHGPPAAYGAPPGPGYGGEPAYPESGGPGRFPPKRGNVPPYPGPPGAGGAPPFAGRRDGPPGPGGPRGGPGKGNNKPAFQVDLPPEPNILQEVFVNRKLVGKIIGPGGETAANIRRAARCFLHVRKETRPDDTQCVEVSGNAAQVTAGVNKVVEFVKEEAQQDPKLQPRVAPQAVTYFDVMPEMIGYVLGSKGATVKMLRQKTHTEIQVTDAAPETGLQAITIRGPPDRVQEAYVCIRGMLEKYDPRRGKGPPPGLLSTGPPSGRPGPPGGPPGPPGMGPRGMGHPGYDMPPPHDMPPHPYHHGPPGPMYDRPPYEDPRADPYYGHGHDDRGYPPPHMPEYGGREGYGPERGSPGRADRYGAAADPRQPGVPAGAAGSVPPAAVAPAAAPPAGTPQFLVLHPDGTYRPAQIILQPGAAGAAAGPPAPGGAAGTAAIQQLLGQVAANTTNGQPNMLAQQAQQALAGLFSQQQAAAPAPAGAAAPQYATYPSSQTAAASYPSATAAPYGQAPSTASPYGAQQQQYAQYAQQAAAYPGYDASGNAAAPAPTAAAPAAAAPASGAAPGGATSGLTLQQLQQYYNSYAQMYQQAAQQQQMMHQPGAPANGAAPPTS